MTPKIPVLRSSKVKPSMGLTAGLRQSKCYDNTNYIAYLPFKIENMVPASSLLLTEKLTLTLAKLADFSFF
jgi:hypothetical protein